MPLKESDRAARPGSYPYYGAQGVIDHIDDYLYDGSYLLVAEDGANLQSRSEPIAQIATGRFWVNNHAHVVEPRPGVDMRFLMYFLNCNPLRGSVRGTAQPKLTQTDLNRLAVPLPPLPEQRRIAVLLDQADALRAKRRAAIAQLDTLAQTIFIDMFGEPDENPRAWPVRPVADFVLDFQGGKSIDPEDDGAYTLRRILKISAVTSMRFDPSQTKPISDSYRPEPDHFVRPGDLLFSRANTSDLVGAVAYVGECPDNLLLPDKLWRFVWKQPAVVEPLFVWMLFRTPSMRRAIAQRATGTSGSMKNISKAKLYGITTIVPPLELQREFVQRLLRVETIRRAQQCSLARLDELFASLQRRAFQGGL